MWTQLLNTKEKVRFILNKHAKTKDSDTALITFFWHYELIKSGIDIDKITGRDFLHQIFYKKLTDTETIRRCRQKLQEQHPELRGSSYKSRQTESKTITKNIKHL